MKNHEKKQVKPKTGTELEGSSYGLVGVKLDHVDNVGFNGLSPCGSIACIRGLVCIRLTGFSQAHYTK